MPHFFVVFIICGVWELKVVVESLLALLEVHMPEHQESLRFRNK